MQKELSDYTEILSAIETDQRTDLAVHLYSTHLLHRVNPSFPNQRWASWPRGQRVPDPSNGESFADSCVNKNAFGEPQIKAEGIVDASDLSDEDAVKAQFRRTAQKVRVRPKYYQNTGPKAVLMNELHALLKERIRCKLQGKSVHADLKMEDSEIMQAMATKLGDRVASLMSRLKSQSIRRSPNHLHQKNWQDILISDLQDGKLHGAPELLRTRRLYQRCRQVFHDSEYNYQYDAEDYKTETPDQNQLYESVPKFDFMEHLRALESAQEGQNMASKKNPLKKTKTAPEHENSDKNIIKKEKTATSSSTIPLLEQIRLREADFRFKEQMFIRLWDQAAEMQQISWEQSAGSTYKPHAYPGEDEQMKLSRSDEFKDVALSADDFIVNVKRS